MWSASCWPARRSLATSPSSIGWLAPVFIGAIAVGLGAQIWFILGWMKAAKQDGEGRPS
jgi:hypothetical protein